MIFLSKSNYSINTITITNVASVLYLAKLVVIRKYCDFEGLSARSFIQPVRLYNNQAHWKCVNLLRNYIHDIVSTWLISQLYTLARASWLWEVIERIVSPQSPMQCMLTWRQVSFTRVMQELWIALEDKLLYYRGLHMELADLDSFCFRRLEKIIYLFFFTR